MKHIIAVLLENEPGALSRVVGLFSARGYNIESLTVAPTEDPSLSRMSIVTTGSDEVLEQITKQLNKLVEVLKVVELDQSASVQRQILLIKVRSDAAARSHIIETVDLFRGKIIDVGPDTLTIEATGKSEKLDALLTLLEPYGIRELVQSGVVAIGRGPRSITDRTLRSA